MEHVCKNCRLYNEGEGVCNVSVIIGGESYELPVLPNDSCHWERIDKEIQQDLRQEIKKAEPYFKAKLIEEVDHKIEVKQMRMWSDGKNGYIETQD